MVIFPEVCLSLLGITLGACWSNDSQTRKAGRKPSRGEADEKPGSGPEWAVEDFSADSTKAQVRSAFRSAKHYSNRLLGRTTLHPSPEIWFTQTALDHRLPAKRLALLDGTGGSKHATARTPLRCTIRQPRDPARGRSVCRSDIDTDAHRMSTPPFFSPANDNDAGVPIAQHTLLRGTGNEARKRE